MPKNNESLSKVHIGNVSGGIHNSIIAGRDVIDTTITIGGQQVPVDKEPNLDELKQLLSEVQRELTEVVTQKEALKEVSVSAPFTVQGVEAIIKEAVEEVKPDTDSKKAKSIQEKLTEASNSLSKIMDRAKTVVKKTGEFSGEVNTLTEKLVPLVKKIGVAMIWIYKLWL